MFLFSKKTYCFVVLTKTFTEIKVRIVNKEINFVEIIFSKHIVYQIFSYYLYNVLFLR